MAGGTLGFRLCRGGVVLGGRAEWRLDRKICAQRLACESGWGMAAGELRGARLAKSRVLARREEKKKKKKQARPRKTYVSGVRVAWGAKSRCLVWLATPTRSSASAPKVGPLGTAEDPANRSGKNPPNRADLSSLFERQQIACDFGRCALASWAHGDG